MVEIAGNNISLESLRTLDVNQVLGWSVNTRDSYFLLNSVLPLSSEDLLLELNAPDIQLFVVKDKKNNKIGLVKAYSINLQNKHALVAFTMQPSQNNTKLMQEAAEIILDRLFGKLNINKIFAHAFPYERELKQVLKNLLFAQEGTYKEHIFLDNQFQDLEVFGLAKEDYYK